VKSKPHQHVRDMVGSLVKVTRLFYCCPHCKTVAWFDMREDGKRGDLSKMIQAVKSMGSLEEYAEKRSIPGSANQVDA